MDALLRVAAAVQEVPPSSRKWARLPMHNVLIYRRATSSDRGPVDLPGRSTGSPLLPGSLLRPGIPLMVLLVSSAGTCTLGFTIDPAAITSRPELLMRCMVNAFTEILEVDLVAARKACRPNTHVSSERPFESPPSDRFETPVTSLTRDRVLAVVERLGG